MDWEPATESEIKDFVRESYARMTPEQRRIWDVMKVPPQKWTEYERGSKGGGFWVVAVIGSSVIWFNDIEDGFNRSLFSEFGKIGEYWCNQDELEHQVQNVAYQLREKTISEK